MRRSRRARVSCPGPWSCLWSVLPLSSGFRLLPQPLALPEPRTNRPPLSRKKGRDLNVRRGYASVVFLPCRYFGLFLLFEIYVLKGVYATSPIVPDGRLRVGVAHFDWKRARHIDFQDFFKADAIAEKVVIEPEMSGRNRVVDDPADMKFQQIADRKRLDGDMLLPLVGVHGCFAADRRIQFLNV